jgi:hypothetical protein
VLGLHRKEHAWLLGMLVVVSHGEWGAMNEGVMRMIDVTGEDRQDVQLMNEIADSS